MPSTKREAISAVWEKSHGFSENSEMHSVGRVSEQRCMIYGRARSLALNCAFFISFLLISYFVYFLLLCFFELLGYSCDWAFSNLLKLVIWNNREHF